jgi:hypothetical protein
MKKLLRLIEILIVLYAGAFVFVFIMDTAPWQVKFACGVLLVGYMLHTVRSLKR